MSDVLEKKCYRIAEFCSAYGIGRTRTYEEIKKGRLKIIKFGNMTLISQEAAQAWLRSVESDAQKQTA